jgi:hypothetical protein
MQSTEMHIYIGVDGRLGGRIDILDVVRDDAAASVATLKKAGIRTLMLSGRSMCLGVSRYAELLSFLLRYPLPILETHPAPVHFICVPPILSLQCGSLQTPGPWGSPVSGLSGSSGFLII